MADPNTRQGKRTPVTLKIKFKSETLEQFIERYAVDVSQGGIFIRTKEPLAVGTQMRFEFQLRDASPLIAGEGTVVWTRENDPSRPAIAPGMGVRFDRLADGSQAVLERILSEKAKQAPQRSGAESTKPPLFTDTPTRVAPMPVQEALLGDKQAFNDQHTPLPKPMPFHSDADDFDEQAFEEATKVRALDELIAQTADGNTGTATAVAPRPADELAARRVAASVRADSTIADPPQPSGPPVGSGPIGVAKSTPVPDRDSAPGLPSPPSPGSPATPAPRLLDTTPSPRAVEVPPAELGRTKLGGFEAPRPGAAPSRGTSPPPPADEEAAKDAETRPSGMQAVATEPSGPAKRPAAPAQKPSAVPVVILVLVLLAAAGAGVWFFYLRPKAEEAANKDQPTPGSAAVATPGSAVPGDATPAVATTADAAPEPPKGPIVDTKIGSSTKTAIVEIVGTDQEGPVPFTAKLEKDREYKARISAPGFATLELDIKGGQDKITAKLDPKPRVISVTSDPPGALILVDNAATGHTTPHNVELTKAQAAKKRVKITMRKSGHKPVDKLITADAYEETDEKLVAKVEEKLPVQVIRRPPPPPPPDQGGSTDAGTGAGSATAPPPDSGTTTPPPPGGGTGATTPPTPGSGTAKPPTPTPGSAAKPPTPTPGTGSAAKPPAGTGSATKPAEPEPDFVR